MRSVGIILLAAGESIRMGRPKQLLPFRGTTLLRHAALTAATTGLSPLVVVLGAEAEACAVELKDLSATVVRNADWKQGMGSSLRAGMEALGKTSPEIQAVLVMLHDQPLISTPALLRLVELWRPPEHPIVAAFYGGKPGVPAVFDRNFFPELKNLQGTEGAKKILTRHASLTSVMDLPEALDDIDSPEDYRRLKA
jgi:molybdenum cofactor cytidylyltransferase